MTLREKVVPLGKRAVHFLEAGEDHARVLLLLHGGMGDARANWSAVLPELAQHFHVFAPDLPGYGQTETWPMMDIQQLIDWIKQFLDSQEIEQVAVVGHGFGGLLARLFGAAYPSYATALILANGGTIPNLPLITRVLARLPVLGSSFFVALARSTASEDQLARLTFGKDGPPADYRERVQANLSGFAGMMRMLAISVLPEKRTPPVRTLLLWGADDAIVPLADAERIKASIRDAVLAPLAGCGNLPHIEAPDVFVWQIMQFLEENGRPTRPDLPGVGLLR